MNSESADFRARRNSDAGLERKLFKSINVDKNIGGEASAAEERSLRL